MDRAGHGSRLLVGLHKLQHGHLRRSILHRNAIWPEGQHRLAPLPGLRVKVVCVRDQDLVRQRQPAAEFLSGLGKHVRHLGIQLFSEIHRHDLSPYICPSSTTAQNSREHSALQMDPGQPMRSDH